MGPSALNVDRRHEELWPETVGFVESVRRLVEGLVEGEVTLHVLPGFSVHVAAGEGSGHVHVDATAVRCVVVNVRERGDGVMMGWVVFGGVLRVTAQEVFQLWPFVLLTGLDLGGGARCRCWDWISVSP